MPYKILPRIILSTPLRFILSDTALLQRLLRNWGQEDTKSSGFDWPQICISLFPGGGGRRPSRTGVLVMGWLKIAIFVSCFWGCAAMANTPDAIGGERQDLQTIQSWMAHINTNYKPFHNVQTFQNLNDPQVRLEIKKELYILESIF